MSAKPPASLLGTRFDRAGRAGAVDEVLARAATGGGGYVCLANVHVVMEARSDPAFAAILAGSWRCYPDGKPVAWALGWHGHPTEQVRGPTLADDLCARAAATGVAVGLYGGRPEVVAALERELPRRHPGLRLAYAWSPPFRPLGEEEQRQALEAIRAAGVGILLVGLGCPRQERWMAAQHQALPAVLLGVGAWFDFASGAKREAPAWMRGIGLEWLFRLCQEPRRLAWRYLWHNPRFCLLVLLSLLRPRR